MIKGNKSLSVTGLIILPLIAILIYNFFVIGKYADYPWWHSHGNDADAAYMVTAIGLINNSDYVMAQHPAAPFSSFNALVLRVVAHLFPSCQSFLHLSNVTSMYDVFDIIEKGVYIGRLQALVLSSLFAIMMFQFLVFLTHKRMIAFLLVFYLITSEGFLLYTYWVRPELLSVIFIIMLLFYAFFHLPRSIQKGKNQIGSLSFLGFMLGLLVFTKIQLLTFNCVFCLGLLVFFLIHLRSIPFSENQRQQGRRNLLLSLMNILIFPWWALKRPEVFPPGFCGGLNIVDSQRLLQNQTPDNYFGLVFAILGFLLGLSLFFIIRIRNKEPLLGAKKWLFFIGFINSFVFGFILSIYGSFLLVFSSFSQYIKNTHLMLYTLLVNLFDGTFLASKSTISLAMIFRKIEILHNQESRLAFINGFHAVLMVLAVSGIGFFFTKGATRKKLLLVCLFIFAGIFMDASACFYLKERNIYSYYAIYSLTLFTIGLGIFVSANSQKFDKNKIYWFIKGFSVVILVFLLILNVFTRVYFLMNKTKSTRITDQGPLPVYEGVLGYTRPFFMIVEEGIRRSEAHQLSESVGKYQKTAKDIERADRDLTAGLGYYKGGAALLKVNKQKGIASLAQSIKSFRAAIADNPREIKGYLLLGRTYMNLGAFKAAIIIFNAATIEFPNEPILHQMLSLCYAQIGDKGLAEANEKMAEQ